MRTPKAGSKKVAKWCCRFGSKRARAARKRAKRAVEKRDRQAGKRETQGWAA